jgi:hypothetical protein
VLVTGFVPAAASVWVAAGVWACATQKAPRTTKQKIAGFIVLSRLIFASKPLPELARADILKAMLADGSARKSASPSTPLD